MKAEIDINGILTISAENDLEGYALQKWSLENISDKTPNIIISWDLPKNRE